MGNSAVSHIISFAVIYVRNTARNEARNTVITLVEAYFIYDNGTALEYITVINLVIGNPNPEYRETLSGLGLKGVVSF